jgi:Fe-S oxidoreductase/nitrate reductase gamma subunit
VQAEGPLQADANPLLMREIFGNVSHFSKIAFYLLAVAAMVCFCWGVYRRFRLWNLGNAGGGPTQINNLHPWTDLARRILNNIILQRRMVGRLRASRAHRLLFIGMGVLFIGTLLIALEHVLADLLGRDPSNPVFHKGLYYAIYEIILDGFGIAMLMGCFMLLIRRWQGSSSIAKEPLDWMVLLGLLAIGCTGYLVEGLRILHAQTPLPGLSFLGYPIALGLEAIGIEGNKATGLHVFLWWSHAFLALGLIAAFPYTRLLHSIAGALNLLSQESSLGTMRLVEMEEVEETGLIGVGSIENFSRIQLRTLDACVSCGRCEDACPAFEADKPLSPRNLVQDLRSHMNLVGPGLLAQQINGDSTSTAATNGPPSQLHGETISAETLWSCTTCSACADLCPLGISPVELITDMRRHLVGEGQLRGSPATSLQKTQRTGNPWGLPAEDRFVWADGLQVPTVEDNPDFDILYWVGCAAAYDRRIQRVVRSMVKLLQVAGVNFAVLGRKERCTGEAARRMGDEFLFQELAAMNVEVLNQHGVRRIVAHCPHCVNSFLHDYPQMGGQYEVVHHSQLLAELQEQGRLVRKSQPTEEPLDQVTYHDPCYLARVNQITEPPRTVITHEIQGLQETTTDRLLEVPRNRRNTSCCGAGGGRMWFDDAPNQRSGVSRMQELQATGAKTVAVACPFCLVMVTDGMAAAEADVEVRDIAEILAAELNED